MANQHNPVTIQLLAFSGRPNPSWTASEDLVKAIEASVKESEKKSYRGELPFPQLGYQGFVIESSGKSSGLPGHIRVFRGILFIGGPGQKMRNLEDSQNLERLLIDEAVKEGFGEILKELGVK
ncbi:MAG: hypothetical protein WA004_10175 [Saprospiraceae bacterium]